MDSKFKNIPEVMDDISDEDVERMRARIRKIAEDIDKKLKASRKQSEEFDKFFKKSQEKKICSEFDRLYSGIEYELVDSDSNVFHWHQIIGYKEFPKEGVPVWRLGKNESVKGSFDRRTENPVYEYPVPWYFLEGYVPSE